jgi:arylsulfatase A-like enzyme
MRVPTIAWWPGQIPAGTKSDEITSMMDILPTFIQLSGGDIPADRKLDGGNIWPILKGQADAESPYEAFYYYRGLKLQAIRQGDWKLHLASGELYNLKDDISESKNIAKANPSIVKDLKNLVERMNGDLGTDGIGPGCRPLGKVANPKPLINHEGTIREGFAP